MLRDARVSKLMLQMLGILRNLLVLFKKLSTSISFLRALYIKLDSSKLDAVTLKKIVILSYGHKIIVRQK